MAQKKAEELAPATFLALRQGELVGMAALGEESNRCPLLSSGYGRGRGAVAALTALHIALAEQRGSVAMKAEVFRSSANRIFSVGGFRRLESHEETKLLISGLTSGAGSCGRYKRSSSGEQDVYIGYEKVSPPASPSPPSLAADPCSSVARW